jgi:Holliday junction resolvase RusA-like endonuclease
MLKLEGPLKLTAKFYFKDRTRGDLDNLIKSTLDGLQYGNAFDNDKQILSIIGEIKYDDDERAEIMIEEMEG